MKHHVIVFSPSPHQADGEWRCTMNISTLLLDACMPHLPHASFKAPCIPPLPPLVSRALVVVLFPLLLLPFAINLTSTSLAPVPVLWGKIMFLCSFWLLFCLFAFFSIPCSACEFFIVYLQFQVRIALFLFVYGSCSRLRYFVFVCCGSWSRLFLLFVDLIIVWVLCVLLAVLCLGCVLVVLLRGSVFWLFYFVFVSLWCYGLFVVLCVSLCFSLSFSLFFRCTALCFLHG